MLSSSYFKNTWDIIFLRDVLEHFCIKDATKLLKLCHDNLNSGGCVIIQVPNGMSPYMGSIYFSDITHKHAYTTNSLHQICSISGFSSFKSYPWRVPIHSVRTLVAYYIQYIIHFIISLILLVEGLNRPILTRTYTQLQKSNYFPSIASLVQ